MYLYHANALAFGGTFARPFSEPIPSQAPCTLGTSGGTGSARAEKFNFKGVLSFDSAQSDVAGGIEKRNGKDICVTRVSVSIEGLNILNMFVADRVALRLAAEHDPTELDSTNPDTANPKQSEPSIITTGSHFDNLVIAGHPAKVNLAHDRFHKYDTYGKLQKDYKTPGTRGDVQKCMLGCELKLNGGEAKHLADIHATYNQYADNPGKPARAELQPTVICSCVSSVEDLKAPEIRQCGPIITIPQFGTIYLGEVIISHGHRRVNMFRLELGSPDGGTIVGGSGGSNGTGFP